MTGGRFPLVLCCGLVAGLWAGIWAGGGAQADGWADGRGGYHGNFGFNELVVAEADPLRRQIRRCWKVGWKTKTEHLDVHIRIRLRPDGTVRTARVIDRAWILADPTRWRVARSARRAVLSRRCNPLRIPLARQRTKLRKGQRITLTLNPRHIFRR